MASETPPIQTHPDRFLVCGLGSLGQHCVANLKAFGVRVGAIDRVAYDEWEIEAVPELLDAVAVGDCRHPSVLERMEISAYRAVLFVTSDDRVNIEAAFEARRLNPAARLVVRSGKENLNLLLGAELGNFIAFEPKALSVPAFVQSALGDQAPASFHLEGRLAQVIRHEVRPRDSLAGLRLRKLQTDGRRIVRFQRPAEAMVPDFYNWDPDTVLRPGDTVVWIESRSIQPSDSPDGRRAQNGWRNAVQSVGSVIGKIRRGEALALGRRLLERVHRLVFLCGVALLVFLLTGGLLFYRFGPDLPFVDAVFATAGLLLGGYSDLLGADFRFTQPFPWWMRLFGLGLTVVGTVFVGVLYALITQSLISARLRFFRKAVLPEAGHVIVIGMGNFGRRVVRRLRESGERVAAVSLADDPAAAPHPEVPHLAGPRGHLEETLAAARVSTAQSVIAVTRDEMENLEMALMVRRLNPGAALSIRTYHPRFSENMAHLFPRAKVLCVSALAAEAFVAAAFGEKVAQLFRLDDRTIIVTEYHIEADDTLHDLLISEVAYGYRVVPILHIQPDREAVHWMPSEDFRLAVGDRLFVLATMDGLRRIERGIMFHRQFAVWIPALAPSLVSVDPFEIANIIARISGCDIGEARALMDRLPAKPPRPLYRHQAQAMVESLRKNRVAARVVRLSP